MDKRGDRGETIKLTGHWPGEVPANGFKWVSGLEVWPHGEQVRGDFLVRKPGPSKPATFTEELYEDLGNLVLTKEAVLRFANKYGSLRLTQTHFHMSSKVPAQGEPWEQWKREVTRFKQAMGLWYWLEVGDARPVKRFIESIRSNGPGLMQTPLQWPKEPTEFAKALVVTTVNYGLGAVLRLERPCGFTGCDFEPHADNSSHTTAVVRLGKSGDSFDLVVESTDLLKAAWLQFAAVVCGDRKLKKCEAPDCPRPYMDVTGSARPGARRMHARCEERIRKRRYRERKVEV